MSASHPLLGAVAALLLACALRAHAEEAPAPSSPPPPVEGLPGVGLSGISASLSASIAKPSGDLALGVPLTDHVLWGWPIRLDLGHRFASVFRATFFAVYAPLSPRHSGDRGLSGAIGGELNLLFPPVAVVEPWLGAGAGLEILSLDEGPSDARTHFTAFGWQVPILRLGLGFRLSRNLSIGPLVAASFGQFTRVEIERPTAPGTLERTTVGGRWHGSLEAGLRVAADL
jgi:hypothetical protein